MHLGKGLLKLLFSKITEKKSECSLVYTIKLTELMFAISMKEAPCEHRF